MTWIYLDYNATTPTDPRVVEAMLPFFTDRFGNASSTDHAFGLDADRAVGRAREQVAELIGADPAEIVFTSGATEADNLAVIGAAKYTGRDSKVLVSAIEHPAVLEAARSLGGCAEIAPVASTGVIDAATIADRLDRSVALVSVMAANNETGAVQPVAEIGALCRDAGIPFHTDAVQLAGRLPTNVDTIECDFLSLSAHKMYGPKGVGALYVRRRGRRAKLRPLLYGGSHERSLRAGTLNVPAIVGFGEAAELVKREQAQRTLQEFELRETLISTLRQLPRVSFNVEPGDALPQTLSVRFADVGARALITRLRERVAISAGSACATLSSKPSHVLLAQGLTEEEARSTVRISFGRFTTDAEVIEAAMAIVDAVSELRALAAVA